MVHDSPTARRKVLILFAHPALENSRVNRILTEGLDSMEGITFHDLYEAYPDMNIDVPSEQALLRAHDVIVMQHPILWYSTPSILKEWQDLVLEHGWAYGTNGDALRGKILVSAVTTGGRSESYRHGGHNGYSVRDFLLPIAQTARLCGISWLAPFVAHGAHTMTRDEMVGHARDYRRLLVGLRDDLVDLDTAADPNLPYINEDLDRVLRELR